MRPANLLPLLFTLVPAVAQTGQNINHALTGTATQSADHPTFPAAVASRAIDGNRNGAWLDDSSNTTAPMAAPWWQVALAGPSLVHEIVLYPRAEATLTFMSDTLVELTTGSTVVWSQWCCTGGAYPARGTALRLLLPPGGLTGDTVRISRPNETNGAISLAEVEVLQIAPITPVNWAVFGTATQITTTTSYPAANAIDGNTDSYLPNNSCSQSSVGGASYSDWWEVTLPRKRYDEIRVWPSTWQPTYPFYVRTYDGATAVETWFANNPPTTGPFIVFPGAPAAYIDRVRVFRNSLQSPIVIAEVEVINYSALDAEATPFGIGCLGSAGVPTLRATTPPVNDSNFDVLLTNVPGSPGIALIASGLSYTASGALPLPFDLGLLGASGCQSYVSLDFTQVAIATSGVATSTFPVPNNSGLLGFPIYQQAFVLDAPANTLGVTASNAVRARIGL